MSRPLRLLPALLLIVLAEMPASAGDAPWRLDPRFGDHGVVHTTDALTRAVSLCPANTTDEAPLARVEWETADGSARQFVSADGQLVAASREASGACPSLRETDDPTWMQVAHGNGNLRVRSIPVDAGTILMVERVGADGRADRYFGRAGRTRITLPGNDARAAAAAIGPQQQISITGTTRARGREALWLLQLTRDGRPVPADAGEALSVVDARRGQVRIDSLLPLADGYLVAGRAGTPASLYIAQLTDRPIVCGDGIREGDEACEPGSAHACCTEDCRLSEPGEICRNARGHCDAAEICDGSSPSCPDDRLQEAGFRCRGRAGPCDREEFCDGESAACPADEKSLEICRPASTGCDLPEACDGLSDQCPADAFAPAGSACFDASACTVGETCDGGGSCSGGTFREEICNAWVCGKAKGFRVTELAAEAASARTITTAGGSEDLKPQPGMPGRQICARADLAGPRALGEDALAASPTPDTVAGLAGGEIERFLADVASPREPGHVLAFPLAPARRPTLRLRVHDRFGTFEVTTAARRWLSLPTSVDGSTLVAGLPGAFACFPVRRPLSLTPVRSGIPAQLPGGASAWQVDIAGLASVCVAASVDDDATVERTDGFACHKIVGPAARSRLEPRRMTEASNAFGTFRLRAGRLSSLCVPADVERLPS